MLLNIISLNQQIKGHKLLKKNQHSLIIKTLSEYFISLPRGKFDIVTLLPPKIKLKVSCSHLYHFYLKIEYNLSENIFCNFEKAI